MANVKITTHLGAWVVEADAVETFPTGFVRLTILRVGPPTHAEFVALIPSKDIVSIVKVAS